MSQQTTVTTLTLVLRLGQGVEPVNGKYYFM